MSDPFFSVIIPTYNRADFLGNAIRSGLRQQYDNFELIVVDDGSTDGTEQVVKAIKDDRVKYFRKANGERGAARNFGFSVSKGDYINFVDSDDTLYDNHLLIAATMVTSLDQPDVFHLGYDIKTPDGRLLRTVSQVGNLSSRLLRGNILSCNGVFIRRPVMEENLFKEDRGMASLEDWELWLRLAARFKIHGAKEITSTIIQHDERSVMTGNCERIERKATMFVKYVAADPAIQATFGKKLAIPFASLWSYTALHLAIAGASRKKIMHYLIKAVRKNPLEIFRRRFLVVLKFLLIR